MIKLVLTLLLLVISVNYSMALDYRTEIMNKAETYLYVREATNNNDAPEIDKFLAYLGLPKRLAYCISFDIFVVGTTYQEHGRRCPVPRIGRCSTWLKTVKRDKYAYTVIDPKMVEYGVTKLKPAMFAVWSHNKTYSKVPNDSYDWSGHAELVDSPVTYTKFKTIGANTTGVDDIASQREQTKKGPVGGVWRKTRNISKMSEFATEAFVEVN